MVCYLWGGNIEKTRAALKKYVARRIIRPLGEFPLHETGGRGTALYIGYRLKIKKGWIIHDTMLHAWRLLVPEADIRLGYDCDPEFRADGECTFSNGIEGVIEMDRQSESLAKIMRRLSIHKGHGKNVFFCTLSQPWIRKLQIRLENDPDLADKLWFAVWHDLMKTPNVWEDVTGVRTEVYPARG